MVIQCSYAFIGGRIARDLSCIGSGYDPGNDNGISISYSFRDLKVHLGKGIKRVVQSCSEFFLRQGFSLPGASVVFIESVFIGQELIDGLKFLLIPYGLQKFSDQGFIIHNC